jgi:hypothetical protein
MLARGVIFSARLCIGFYSQYRLAGRVKVCGERVRWGIKNLSFLL